MLAVVSALVDTGNKGTVRGSLICLMSRVKLRAGMFRSFETKRCVGIAVDFR